MSFLWFKLNQKKSVMDISARAAPVYQMKDDVMYIKTAKMGMTSKIARMVNALKFYLWNPPIDFFAFSFVPFLCFLWIWNGKSVIKSRIKYFCPITQFTCLDKTCISILGRCDGIVDCPNDQADEQDCRMFFNALFLWIFLLTLTLTLNLLTACKRDEWQCDYGQCLSIDKRCNGNIDCPDDISDERHCNSKFVNCLEYILLSINEFYCEVVAV